MRALFIAGVVLLSLSAKPLLLMGREVVIDSKVNSRYSVEGFMERGMAAGALQATIGTHTVRLADDQPVHNGGDVRVDGLVRIIVDGSEYSHPALAKIRLAQRDANRYWGFVYLMRLRDQQTGIEHIVVAQNIGQDQFRTVSIGIDGLVKEDLFDYSGRCSPPVRALLIQWVVPHPSGFCSDVMQVWPSIFYPVLYPWTTGVVGLAFLVAGGVLKLKRREHRKHEP